MEKKVVLTCILTLR